MKRICYAARRHGYIAASNDRNAPPVRQPTIRSPNIEDHTMTNIHWAHDTDMDWMKDNEPFREAWWKTEGIPGSYTRLNGIKLWEYAHQVPQGGLVVELGVDQGRSSSLLLNVAERRGFALVLIDSWESILVDNKFKVMRLCEGYPRAKFHILHAKSAVAAPSVIQPIDMLHIDADHYAGGVDVDCVIWLPKLRPGGVVCFHDYMATFPVVTESIDKYTAGWEDLGAWDSLAIRRKP